MDFKEELGKYGYNKGNSIDVEILIDEILPKLFSQKKQDRKLFSEEQLKSYGEFCVAKFNGFESVSLNKEIFEEFKKEIKL